MPARRTARPRRCSTSSAATATGRRTSTSSSRRRATGKLTTQINIDGDEYLHDDFAFATRDELIPPVEKVEDAARIRANGLNDPYTAIAFDFVLHAEAAAAPATEVHREHAPAA